MIIAAHHLLTANPSPTRAEIQEGLAGNLCRCGGYSRIIEAVEQAAGGER
jgi:aerobic-type carbon monoxide dehydrogenase small subunit (CoxS/CutS family)